MKSELINDYWVNVPADMRAYIAKHDVPGDYDAIIYRGIEISTLCSDDPEGTLYNGMFSILWDYGEPDCVLSLDEARSVIDAKLAKYPHLDPALEEVAPYDDMDFPYEPENSDLEPNLDPGFSAVM